MTQQLRFGLFFTKPFNALLDMDTREWTFRGHKGLTGFRNLTENGLTHFHARFEIILTEAPGSAMTRATLHHLPGPSIGQHAIGQAQEFRFQIAVAHGFFDAPHGLLHELLDLPAVLERNRDARLVLPERRVDRRRHSAAQRHGLWLLHRAVAAGTVTPNSTVAKWITGITQSSLAPLVNEGKKVQPGSWLVEGIGEDFIPSICHLELVSKAYAIYDEEAFHTARELLKKEGVLAGSSVGTLFAAMLVRARTRDVMLPILLYPITIPVIIAGVRGTSALLTSPVDEPVAMLWIGLLMFFDVVFVTLALWTFEPLMTE